MNSNILAKSSIIAFGLCLLYFPVTASASSCNRVVGIVNADVYKYPDNALQNLSLPWTNFTWLEHSLGKTNMFKITEDNQRSYTWHCPENRSNNITVTVNASGRITSITGMYSSIKGARMFSTTLDNNVANATPQQITHLPAPVVN